MSSNVYDNIVRACHERGLSVTGACRRAGLSSGSKSAWSSGKTPRPDTIVKLARVLDVSPDELMYGPVPEKERKEKEPARLNTDGLERSIIRMLAQLTDDEWMAAYYFISGMVSKRDENPSSNQE